MHFFFDHQEGDVVGRVAGGDAGPAVGDDDLDLGVAACLLKRSAYLAGVVLDDSREGDPVTVVGEHVGDEFSARVGLLGARVAHRDDDADDGVRALGPVLFKGFLLRGGGDFIARWALAHGRLVLDSGKLGFRQTGRPADGPVCFLKPQT